MANHHSKIQPKEANPAELQATVELFLASCKRPAVLEDGEEVLDLSHASYVVELRAGRLWLESWSDNRTLSRWIVGLAERKPGSLACKVHRFAKPPGRLVLLDLSRPAASQRTLMGQRRHFGERFRSMLARQFPGWEVESLSASLDLRRSFSATYPRARLVRGMHTLAVVACPDADAESNCLTTALLWFDYLRRRAEPEAKVSLGLFLPEGSGCLTAQRLKWLTGQSLECRIFLFNEHGAAGQVDPGDLGNLDTRVCTPDDNSGQGPGVLTGRLELELEHAVRGQIEVVDATLLRGPIHKQVLTFVAGERTLLDLLAVDPEGRLCIIELKADEDLQLPLQALDYWMRIRWHLANGELQGLFPETALSSRPPRLLLVAPATAFHETNATILRCFSPEIEVERIGVNSDWNRRLKVVMRLRGAHAPISHELECHVDPGSCPHP